MAPTYTADLLRLKRVIWVWKGLLTILRFYFKTRGNNAFEVATAKPSSAYQVGWIYGWFSVTLHNSAFP